MDILTGLLIAFLIHTLDNAWVNWLNYRMATHSKDKEDNNNNGVEQMDKMGFTQGYQLKEEKGDGED